MYAIMSILEDNRRKMKTNIIGDTMTAFDRLGDRSLKTSYSRIKVYLLIFTIVLAIMFLYQQYQVFMLNLIPKVAYKWIKMH